MAALETLAAMLKKEEAPKPSKEDRAREAAYMAVGELVVSHAPNGGDWKSLNWEKLAAWIDKYGYEIDKCRDKPLDTKAALSRLRKWQSPREEEKAKEREAQEKEARQKEIKALEDKLHKIEEEIERLKGSGA